MYSRRYGAWRGLKNGVHALDRIRELIERLVAPWPRRGRRLLALNVGDGHFLEALWEAGFDVTGQERDLSLLAQARERLGSVAEFVACGPEHLPYDDDAFDYVVAAAALEFTDNPKAVVAEMGRLASRGILIVFPNALSVFRLECALAGLLSTSDNEHDDEHPARRLRLPAPALWFTVDGIRRMLKNIPGEKKLSVFSALWGPSITWTQSGMLCRWLGNARPGAAGGAFAGLRVDLAAGLTGTGLAIRVRGAAPTA